MAKRRVHSIVSKAGSHDVSTNHRLYYALCYGGIDATLFACPVHPSFRDSSIQRVQEGVFLIKIIRVNKSSSVSMRCQDPCHIKGSTITHNLTPAFFKIQIASRLLCALLVHRYAPLRYFAVAALRSRSFYPCLFASPYSLVRQDRAVQPHSYSIFSPQPKA